MHKLQVTEPPHTRITESYWQRGFDDGYAMRLRTLPNNKGGWDRENSGYLNGYSAGAARIAQEMCARGAAS